MSTEPSREHVEAVARTFSSDEDRCGVPSWSNTFAGGQIAKIILTSTDPAVLDAMQDALVRAGRLRVESDHGWRVPRTPDRWGMTERHVDEVVRAEAAHPHPVSVEKLTRRRHVTEWQEVQP